jgi:hypothetical protein
MHAVVVFGLFALTQSAAGQMLPTASAELGPPPQFSAGVQPQVPPASVPQAASVIAVDPTNRYRVSLLYRNVYAAEDTVVSGWNGSVSPCNAGTTTQAFQDATIERVNVLRALAGLSGDVAGFGLGSTQKTDDQAAALMMVANQSLNHTPPPAWKCYTAAGSTGAGSSNLTLGQNFNYNGPTAIEGYMDDDGSNNTYVGHRRWILYPPQMQMASGDVDAVTASVNFSANALWVFGFSNAHASIPNGTPWPPRGYVPWQLLPENSNRWSLSIQNANFSGASVTMTRNGAALAAPSIDPPEFNGQPNGTFIGDNTLVWEPTGVTYTQPAQDVVYHVSVAGITGAGATTSVSYTVTVINPYDAIFANGFEG